MRVRRDRAAGVRRCMDRHDDVPRPHPRVGLASGSARARRPPCGPRVVAPRVMERVSRIPPLAGQGSDGPSARRPVARYARRAMNRSPAAAPIDIPPGDTGAPATTSSSTPATAGASSASAPSILDRPAPGASPGPAATRPPGRRPTARFDAPAGRRRARGCRRSASRSAGRSTSTACRLELRATPAGQVGLFPEHLPVARWAREHGGRSSPAARLGRPPAVLNLFAYTGLATLAARPGGARVAHVDASRPAVAWARRNAELAGLADRPIRWLVEDAAASSPRGPPRPPLRRRGPRPADLRPRARRAAPGASPTTSRPCSRRSSRCSTAARGSSPARPTRPALAAGVARGSGPRRARCRGERDRESWELVARGDAAGPASPPGGPSWSRRRRRRRRDERASAPSAPS